MEKIFWFIIFALVFSSFFLALIFYPALPEKIPSHWNASGNIDAYMEKGLMLLLMPLCSLAAALLFLILPKIDPLKKNYKYFMTYFRGMLLTLVAFFLYLHVLVIMAGLGFTIKMNYWLMPAMSALFLYLALLLRKSRRNWFIGIRTPWTLSSDVAWDKTNKVASTVMAILAIILLMVMFLEQAILIFIAFLIAAIFGLFVYSYFEYAKEEKSHA